MPSIGAPGAELVLIEALYDAYSRRALGLAYRIVGNMPDAEEVVQEAFLAAWRARATYDPARGSLGTWVLSLVQHRAIDLVRARRRRPTEPLAELDPPDPVDVPERAAIRVDADRAFEALADLPPEQREVIELAYFGGLSHTEIARQVAAPLGTVKGRVRLALDRLRASLEPA